VEVNPRTITFGRKRRFLIATNVLAMSAAAIVLTGVVVFLCLRSDLRRRLDLTEENVFTLSDKTKKVLEGLKDEVRVITLFRPSEFDPKQKMPIPGFAAVTDEVKNRTYDLLREYKFASGGKVQLELLDAYNPRDFQAIEKVREACRAEYNSVVVRAGSGDTVRVKLLGLDDLADIDRGNQYTQPVRYPRMNGYRGEEVLTTTILGITEDKPPVIAFLQGHGEPDPEEPVVTPSSLRDLVVALGADNFHVMTLPLVTLNAIPDEVTILAIINPLRDLAQAEVSAIDAFVQKGGRLFLALDPTSTHTLDDLLRERFGLLRQYKVICEDKSQPGFPPDSNKTLLVIGAYDPGSEVVAFHRSRRLATFFRDAGSIKADGAPPKGVKLTPLLWTGSGAWEEKPDESDQTNEPVSERKGPLVLAYQAQGGEDLHGARLVLFGDSDWLRLALMRDAPGNKDLAVNACDWLAGRESLISIAPKNYLSRHVDLTIAEYNRIFLYTVVLMPLAGMVLGLVVWRVRRK
jgi:hypothetical protein